MRKTPMAANGLSVLALGAALWVAPFAEAQVYKWVDERGVVNYSTTPPANRPSTKVDEDSGRVSTIKAPDQPRPQDTQRERALQQRVDELEREAAKSRETPPQQDLTAQRQSREDCLAQRRIDCDDPSRGLYESERWYPYGVNPPVRPLPRPGAGTPPGPAAPRPMPR